MRTIALPLAITLLTACGSSGTSTSSDPLDPNPPGGGCTQLPLATFGFEPADYWPPARQTYAIDGSSSFSYAGAALTYAWTLESKPLTSAATIQGGGSQPTLFPDVEGTYVVTLVVTDVCGTSSVARRSLVAHDYAPLADAGSYSRAFPFPSGPITVDGSASADANGDPITFAWTLTPPQGSSAVPDDPTQPIVHFTPDVEGVYDLALVVSDGTSTSATQVRVGVYHPAVDVPYWTNDATYSESLDRIVAVTSEPALRIVNPADGTSTSVLLDAQPTAVSLSPDGKSAAVSHYRHFSVVDLLTQAVTGTYAPSTSRPSTYDGGDVLLDDLGWAYAFPTSITNGVIIVKLADETATDAAWAAQADALFVKPRMNSAKNRIFTLGTYTQGVYRLTLGPGSLGSPAWSTTSTPQFAGPFLSPDDARIYTGIGNIFSTADMTLTGSFLDGTETTQFVWVADSVTSGKFLAVTENAYGDDSFRVYDRTNFANTRRHAPAIFSGGTAIMGTVKWAFWKADGSGYYVVFVSGSNTGIATY